MKKALFLLTILFVAMSSLLAQAPQKFTYQSVVRDSHNALLASKVIGVKISILQGGFSGTVTYAEQHTAVTNSNGLMTLQIGGGTLLDGDFSTIDWSTGPYFLKSEIDPQGGTNYTVSGVQQLFSVPYALYSAKSADAFSGNYNDLSNTPVIPTTTGELVNDAGFITETDIPDSVSTFVNDAGYITSADIPANVSAFNNDAGYLTSFTEVQVLSISNDTIYLTGGSFAKLPAGFSGSYNDLTDKPVIPSIPENVSVFNNDAGYLTKDSLENHAIIPDIQDLLDRIAELERKNAMPSIFTTELSPDGEGGVFVGGNVFAPGDADVTDRGVCWNTAENPTIANHYISSDSGLGIFKANIGGFNNNTTYYFRPYATNSYGTSYGTQLSYTTPAACGTEPITDADGNTYHAIQIGNQCWMAENLRTTKYANDSTIQQGTSTSSTVAYWYYPDSNAANKATYGLLYNWKAVIGYDASSSDMPSGVQGICPTGWHLPSDSEWTVLLNYVSSVSDYHCDGTSTYIAKALASQDGWNSDSGDCTIGNTPTYNNATGFGALPAGYYDKTSKEFGSYVYYWTATESNSYGAFNYNMNSNSASVTCSNIIKYRGFSVRCIRN